MFIFSKKARFYRLMVNYYNYKFGVDLHFAKNPPNEAASYREVSVIQGCLPGTLLLFSQVKILASTHKSFATTTTTTPAHSTWSGYVASRPGTKRQKERKGIWLFWLNSYHRNRKPCPDNQWAHANMQHAYASHIYSIRADVFTKRNKTLRNLR